MAAPHKSASTSIVGLNHNVRYKDRVFHVQTEDSVVRQGEVTTNIFLGGNVLFSTRSLHRRPPDEMPSGDANAFVRQQMELQHRAAARALLAGGHDRGIEALLEKSVYQPGVMADGARAPELLVGGSPASEKPRIEPTPMSVPPTRASIPPPASRPPASRPPASRPPASRPPPAMGQSPRSAEAFTPSAGSTPTPVRSHQDPPRADAWALGAGGLDADDIIIRHLASEMED